MAITSATNKNSYLGNASTATYNYTFKLFNASDIVIIIKDLVNVETTLTNIDYTITGVGLRNGGTITLTGVKPYLDGSGFLKSGYQILLKRVVELTQETDIRNQGDFFPEVHEDVFDRQTMASQQLQEQADRSLKFAETESGFDATMPPGLVSNPNASLVVNATGDGLVFGPTTDNIANAQSYANAAELAKTAAELAEVNAETAAAAAAISAAAALVSETNAAASAAAALVSETNAVASALAASGSATTASTAAGNAAISETNAAASALAAQTAETNAETAEANANALLAGFLGVTSVNGNTGVVVIDKTSVGLGNVTNDAQLKRSANDYNLITEKTTVVADDLVLIEDSADTFNKKKVKMSNMGGGSGSGVASWLPTTAYIVGQVVTYNRQLFLCLSAHTSSSDFGSDYNSGSRWILTSKGDNLFQTGATFDSGNPDFWTLTTISGYSAGTWPTAAPTASGTPNISTIGKISGYASLVFSTATQYTLGSGIQYQILNIDKAHQGKVVNLSFDYLITGSSFVNLSGTSANTFHVGLYDVTNSVWVQTSNTYGINSIGTARYNSTVQLASNTTSVIVCVFVANQNATGGVTIAFDNFELSRKIAPIGAVTTDPVQYTPIFGAGYGTVTGSKIFWERKGKFMRVFGSATLGTVAAATGEISLPAGYSIDAAYYQSTAKNIVGYTRYISSAGGAGYGALSSRLGFDGTTLDKVWLSDASNQDVAGATFNKTNVNSAYGANTSALNIDFTVAIAGWSSNVQLSSDAGNSNIVFSGSKSATQAITAAVTDITFTTVKDSSGAWSGSTYTVPSPGDYSVSGSLTDNGTTAQIIYVYLNGAISRTLGFMTAGNAMCGNAILPNLKAGDVISLRSSATTTISANAGQNLSIFKLANPQTIAASDLVAASYKSTAGGSIGTSYTLQSFATKLQDTTGSWNGNTFTAPIQGLFRITSNVRTPNLTLGATQSFDVAVYKNGSIYMLLNSVLGNGGTNNWYMSGGSIEVPLIAGETLQIYAKANIATTQNTDANSNFVSIVKVG